MPEQWVEAEPGVESPADVGPEDHEGSVGEVDDVHHPPHQGEPHRDEREEPSLEDAVDGGLKEFAHDVVPGQTS